MELSMRIQGLSRLPWSPGAVLLAVALPALFVHVGYQPGTTLDVGPVEVGVYLSDLAVLAVGVAALASALTAGAAPLRAGLPVWVAGVALLLLAAVSTTYPLLRDEPYAWAENAVTAAKFAEYAVLAVAVPLLVRRAADLVPLAVGLAAVAFAATAFGALQFLGLVNEFEGRRPGQREPSFVGIHDFSALSGAVLVLAFAAIALGPVPRRAKPLALAAAVAGTVGLVLSGALAGVVGALLAAGAAAAAGGTRGSLTARRAAALAGILALVAAGTVAMRSTELDQLLRFLGVKPAQEETSAQVQTYSQRTLLAYIGLRIWLDHPVAGVGWQQSRHEAYKPHLADARARFPDTAPRAFPSPAHPWGVQNAYVQALADLGVLGLAALAVLLGAGLVLAARAVVRGPPAVAATGLVAAGCVLVAAGVLNGLGLVAGIPVYALLWLALGLAAAAAGGLDGD
jgi:hypothetical protein